MTMTSRPSDSEIFGALHPGVQRWIYSKGWHFLRDVQEKAGRHLLFSDNDVIIAAPTAGGKTEAAFLPIASRLADMEDFGIGCLCVSPLKALINDQHDRLLSLFESIDRPLHRWHGDVAKTQKDRALESRAGTLLMTPESLEAMFVRRGGLVHGLFKSLQFVVIDELHAFIGTERGRHLQSLLHRLEANLGCPVRRVALSATLGDMAHAAACLRPGATEQVTIVKADGEGLALDMQLRGYVLRKRNDVSDRIDSEEKIVGGNSAIAEHLFKTLRGSKNLVFANSRQRTEALSALLRHTSETMNVPNEFAPHHGNLSAELRQDAETCLKDKGRPFTVLCTSTLELGIDIGTVKSVAQIGVPPSVSSLRQRLGRSGRSKEAAVLRMYIEENELTKDSNLVNGLRLQLVEATAMLDLLLRGWCEPQNEERLHLSTLAHQILAITAERGGVRPTDAYRLLCATGPFRKVSTQDFATLLRAMGKHELLIQMDDGVLVLGLRGEREVEHYSFFAVFRTPEEFRVVSASTTLGSLPITRPLLPGQLIIFGGRWWEVREVDLPGKTITVRATRSGQAPPFDGDTGLVHDIVRAEMLRVLASTDVPRYLNAGARDLLSEARATFIRYGLSSDFMVEAGANVVLLPWLGDRKLHTLELLLSKLEFSVERQKAAITVHRTTKSDVLQRLRQITQGSRSLDILAADAKVPALEKYDHVLPPSLSTKNWISTLLDPDVSGIAALLLNNKTT